MQPWKENSQHLDSNGLILFVLSYHIPRVSIPGREMLETGRVYSKTGSHIILPQVVRVSNRKENSPRRDSVDDLEAQYLMILTMIRELNLPVE
jgi:hypothetical protein